MNDTDRGLSTGPATLRGRDVEVRAIEGCVRDALEGSTSALLVEGGRWMGKSRLLREADVVATAAGVRVLDAERGVQAIAEQLEEVARGSPTLVCVDDAHSVERDTAAALPAVAHRLRHLPIGWVVACRATHLSPQLVDLRTHLEGLGGTTISLQPLDGTAVGALIADVVGAGPTPELLQFVERAGGIPGLVVQLLQGLLDEGLLPITSGWADLSEARLPKRLCDMTRADLACVSPAARHAIVVASALGATASFDQLATMLEVTPASLLGTVEELVRAELLVDGERRLRFNSDLIRQAVVETVPREVRRALQRQAVGVLVDFGASPVEPATDLASDADVGDRTAISTLIVASKAVAASDARAAAELSRRAFALTTAGDGVRATLVPDAALLLQAAGRAEEGKELVDLVLAERLAPQAEARIRLGVARMQDLAADVRTAAGRAALALPSLPPDLRAQHLAEQIGNLLADGRPEVAATMLPEAESAVAAADEPSAAVALATAKAQLAYVGGRFDDARRELDRAVAWDIDRDEQVRLVDLCRAELLLASDELHVASEVAADGADLAERTGRPAAARSWRRLLGRAQLQEGRLVDASVTLDAAVDADSPLVTVGDMATTAALSRIAIHTGESRRARVLARLVEGTLGHMSLEIRRQAAWLLAMNDLATGDARGAQARLASLRRDGTASMIPLLMVDISDYTHLARIARGAEDEALARLAVSGAEARSRANPGCASLASVAAHARGLLEDDAALLAEAAELFAGGPRRLAHASAVEDHGRQLLRDGIRAGAVEDFGQALRLYSRCGARWDAARVRRRLRVLGVRRRIVTVDGPTTGWPALTEAELAVVRLVAEGSTNRAVATQLFISPHTVSMHLRHVFTKLGISSRVELARLTLEHDVAA
jgi:DNA-binding CsgD family transcriptional regulator